MMARLALLPPLAKPAVSTTATLALPPPPAMPALARGNEALVPATAAVAGALLLACVLCLVAHRRRAAPRLTMVELIGLVVELPEDLLERERLHDDQQEASAKGSSALTRT